MINKVSVGLCLQISSWTHFLPFFLGKYLGVESLGTGSETTNHLSKPLHSYQQHIHACMCVSIFVLLLFSSFPKKLLELFEKILRQYNFYKAVGTQRALLSDLYKLETQLKWE